MIIKEKQTDVIPVSTEDTGVNAALAIVLVFALIAVIGIYAYVVNNGSSSAPQMPTLIERNNTQTVTPVPTPIPTPVPVQTPSPAPSAPAPSAPEPDASSSGGSDSGSTSPQ